MKKLMSTCTALLLALCMLLPAYSAFAATDNDKIGQRLEKVASQTEGATNYLYKDKDFGVADAVDMLAAVRNYDASDAQVEGFMAGCRKAGCVVGPKAVLTKHNKDWPLARLIAAVNAEHAQMA